MDLHIKYNYTKINFFSFDKYIADLWTADIQSNMDEHTAYLRTTKSVVINIYLLIMIGQEIKILKIVIGYNTIISNHVMNDNIVKCHES